MRLNVPSMDSKAVWRRAAIVTMRLPATPPNRLATASDRATALQLLIAMRLAR